MPRINLINYPGKVILAAMEMAGVRGKSRAAHMVRDTADFLQKRGVQATVVLPSSGVENFNAQSLGSAHLGRVDRIEVLAVDSQLTTLYPEGPLALSQIRSWANNVWEVIAHGKLGRVGLLHGIDHPAGILLWEQSEGLAGIRTVFMPMDPVRFDQVMPIQSEGEFRRFGDPMRGSFHQGGISGFKAGVLASSVVTLWDVAQLNELRDPQKTTYAGFIKYLAERESGKFHILGRGWTPDSESSIPRSYITEIISVYLKALYGTGHEFSVNVGGIPLKDIDVALVSTAEKNPEDLRSPILLQRMKDAHPEIGLIDTAIRYVARYPRPVEQGFRGNMGGVVQMLKEIVENPMFLSQNPQGNFFAFLNGGDGERGFVTTLNSCVKGELVLGERSIGAMSFDSAAMVARQLPSGDKGWVVIFGCDNFMVPNGPIVIGDHLLSETKQGLVMLGLQERVMGNSLDRINYLKDLGIFFIDPKTGNILSFREKMQDANQNFDLSTATEMLNLHGGQNVYKNTFFFAMRADVAAVFYRGLCRPSSLDGKPLHETYDLDYSLHFTTPALMENKADWMALYEKKGKGFARSDWEYLFEHAHRVKELAGGIGGADIGSGEQTWSDIGTIGEYYSRLSQILDDNETTRRVARKMMGVPESISETRSYLDNVNLNNGNHYISHTVFKKGGKVGSHVIIIDSLFEEYVEIPDNTIILGSQIYRIKFKPEDRSPKLLYGLSQNSHEAEFVIESNCAHSSIFLLNGQRVAGIFPINLTGKEIRRSSSPGKSERDRDDQLHYYVLDGKMTAQGIFGIGEIVDGWLIDRLLNFGTDPGSVEEPSVKNIKRINSLTETNDRLRALNDALDSFLTSHGIK